MFTSSSRIWCALTVLFACNSPAPKSVPHSNIKKTDSRASLTKPASNSTRVDRVDYGNQHVPNFPVITWHNANNGHPSVDPAYACFQVHQITIKFTLSFKAEKLGTCPGGVIDFYKYTWTEEEAD